MKLSVKHTVRHRGKTLELDDERETLTVITSTGEKGGSVSWEALIDYVSDSVEEAGPKSLRNHPRSPLAVKVRYQTANYKCLDSITGEIGGGGLFIESSAPARVGDELEMDLALPDNPTAPVHAKGKVTWVRPRPEHYVFYPGMGVQFTEIAEEARARLVDMIQSLKQTRQGSSGFSPGRH
jgi:type IV pilus assembly protein PilZ